jgi:hypothetical protein
MASVTRHLGEPLVASNLAIASTGFAEATKTKRLNTTCYSSSWKNGSSLSYESVSRRLASLA